MKSTIQFLTASAIALTSIAPALAGPNDFFGTSVPGSGDPAAAPPGANAAAQQIGGHAEYTDDEKRMRRKYKSNIASAKSLIAKGAGMIKLGESSKDDKVLKKGKILKDIGERRLAELEANSPFAAGLATKPGAGTQ